MKTMIFERGFLFLIGEQICLNLKNIAVLFAHIFMMKPKETTDSGIEPGTRWEDIPEDWVCPECGATKKAFTLME